MLKRDFELRHEVARLVDAMIATAALTIAILIRRYVFLPSFPELFPSFDFWPQAGWLYLLLIVIWILLYDAFDLYAHKSFHSVPKLTEILFRSSVYGIMLAFFMFYFLRIKTIPRFLIFLFAAFNFALMWTKEMVLRYVEPRWRRPKHLLLVGDPSEFAEFLKRLGRMPRWNFELMGILSPQRDGFDERFAEIARLGTLNDLPAVLHRMSVDYVVLGPSQERFDEIQELIAVCETEGVEAWLLGSFFTTSIARPSVDEFQDLPMLTFRTTPATSWALVAKRVIDVAGSSLIILATVPIMMAAAVAIKLTSPGPILFSQLRCSLRGRRFSMYKFRTMVSGAEDLRQSLEIHNEMQGPVFKMKDDPRITPVGRWLRRYSIDELPQLFNVLKGDMSLVGPRPPIPAEVADYESWHRRRLSMRTGLTGLWQTAGRNSVPFEDWMKLDLEYIDNWSLALDFKILLRTPIAVVRGNGL